MSKSVLLLMAITAVVAPVGCQTTVRGYGVGNGNQLPSDSLQNETQKLKAEREELRTKSKGN